MTDVKRTVLPDVNSIGRACFEGFCRQSGLPSRLPWEKLPDTLKACWLEAAMSANEEARRQVDALAGDRATDGPETVR